MKTESLKEFLERGGKIEKVEPVEPESKEVTVRKTTTGPATIYNLSEGELLFSEKRKKRKKKTKPKYTDEEFDKIMSDLRTSSE